jgi:hypothetical protein
MIISQTYQYINIALKPHSLINRCTNKNDDAILLIRWKGNLYVFFIEINKNKNEKFNILCKFILRYVKSITFFPFIFIFSYNTSLFPFLCFVSKSNDHKQFLHWENFIVFVKLEKKRCREILMKLENLWCFQMKMFFSF